MIRKHKIKADELLICCENTGIYNRTLERVSCKMELDLWVEQALKIERATTDFRGKDDRKDAIRIAQYAKRYEDRKVLFSEAPKNISALTHLAKVRESLLKQSNGLENQLREAKSHNKSEYDILLKSYKGVLQEIEKELKQIEVKIQQFAKCRK
jgi:transposase